MGSDSFSYAIPILSLPGRNGLDLNLTLYYNSHIWTIDNTNHTATFNADRDWPSVGFRLGFGYIEKRSSTVYILTESDGTKRQLNYVTTNVFQSNDASFVEYNTSTKIVRYKNGTQVLYEGFSNHNKPDFWRPIKITDTNGNYISVSYVAGAQQSINAITDTLGRVITFTYDANRLLYQISSGGRTYATFTWTSWPLTYNFGPAPFAATNSPPIGTALNVLASCRYANNTGFRFTYGDWGIINKIENLSSADSVRSSIYLSFPNVSLALNDHPTYSGQTVFDGENTTETLIHVTRSAGIIQTYAVTDPSGTITRSIMDSSGVLTSTEVFDGTPSMRRTSYTWTSLGQPDTVTTTLSDSNQQSKVVYAYGAYGNVSTVSEYDFGLQLRRTTTYSYLTNTQYTTTRHIFDRVTQILVKDSGGVTRARTDFSYDGGTIAGVSPAGSNHDDTNYGTSFTYRGNVTAITRYSNAPASSGAITRNFYYDLFGNLIKADLDCCNQKQWFYTSATQYAYPETITRGPLGTQLSTYAAYNFSTGTVDWTKDENNQTTDYSYDNMDRLTGVTRQDAVSSTTAYNDSDPLPSVESSSNANSAVQVVTTTGLGAVKQREVRNGASTVSIVQTQYSPTTRTVSTSNPYDSSPSEWTVAVADALGRPLSVTPPGNAGQTSYSYYGNSVTITDPAGKQRRNYSDALGRLVQVDEPGWGDALPGAGSVAISGSEQSIPGQCEWDPYTKRTICDPPEYDSGTVSIIVNGVSKTVSYGAGSTASNVAAALAAAITSDSSYPAYASAQGSSVSLTSRLAGQQTNYSLASSNTHAFAQPSFIGTPSGQNFTGGENQISVDDATLARPLTTLYQYDVLDNLTLVTQGIMNVVGGQTLPTQQRSYVYDSLSRLTSATTPESGTVQYTYNGFSNVATRTDARNTGTTYSYDGLNRLTSVSYGDGTTPTVTLAYSASNGRLTSASTAAVGSTPATSEVYAYDPIGHVTGVTKTIGSQTFTVSYAYNSADQLTDLTYPLPTSRLVQNEYDTIGRLSKVKSGATDYISGLTYSAAGQVTHFAYANGVQADFTYNNRLQIASLRYNNGSDLLNLAYNYGTQNNGQIASIQYFNGTTEDQSRSVNYTYDAWSRLRTAGTTYLGQPTSGSDTWAIRWDYDRFGNRATQHYIGGVTGPVNDMSLSISPTTNRITDTGYVYDLAGNLTNDAQHTYVYDAENRQTSVDSGAAIYVYDANGLRVRKRFSGTDTYYVFSGTKVIAEYDVVNGSTTAIREYIYSGSQLVATLATDNQDPPVTTTTYHHPDHLSVRVTTDDGGNNVGEQAHYPFGDTWYSGSGTTTKWRFTSYERDGESTNDYAIARSYLNRLGRFSSADRMSGRISAPQTLNRYSYVSNDPISHIDPLGLLAPGPCLLDPYYCDATWQRDLLNDWWNRSDPTEPDTPDGCDPKRFRDCVVDDVEKILREQNKCSEFFKGTKFGDNKQVADLLRAMYPGNFPETNGPKQATAEGPPVAAYVTNPGKGINSNIHLNNFGAFFVPVALRAGGGTTRLYAGDYAGGTEAGAAAILLHELAHVIGVPDIKDEHTGPNTFDRQTSDENQKKINDACKDQLEKLPH